MKTLLPIITVILIIVSCSPTNQPTKKVERDLIVKVATEIGQDFGKAILRAQRTDDFLGLRSLTGFTNRGSIPDRMRVLFENVGARYEDTLFQFPITVGKTWTDHWDGEVQTTIEGYETVETTAGTFQQCLKHKTVLTDADNQTTALENALINGTRYLWFAKGVGLIKMRYEHSNGIITNAELIDYKVPRKSEEYFPVDLGTTWTYKWKNDYYNEVFIEKVHVAGANPNTRERFKGDIHLAIEVASESGETLGKRNFYIKKTNTFLRLRQASSKPVIKSTQPEEPDSIFFDLSAIWEELFQFPLIVGKTWTKEGLWNSQAQTIIENYEPVEIGIGTFSHCLKHKTVFTGATADSEATAYAHQAVAMVNGTRYLWFVEGVGLVKMRYEHSNGVVTEAELIKYEVPGKSKEYLPLNLNTQWTYKWQNSYYNKPILEKVQVVEGSVGEQTPLKEARYVVTVENTDPLREMRVSGELTPEELGIKALRLRVNASDDDLYIGGATIGGRGKPSGGHGHSHGSGTWEFRFSGPWQEYPMTLNYRLSLAAGKRVQEIRAERWGFKPNPATLPSVRDDCILWPSKFMFIVGGKTDNIEVTFDLPEGWQVSTPWQRIGNTRHRFTVKDQAELVQTYLLIGPHLATVAKSGRTEVALAIRGSLKADEETIRNTVEKFLSAYSKVFKGGPKGRILFIIGPYAEKREKRLEGRGSGRSVTILMDWTLDSTNNHTWAPFLGHEVFHIWNGLTGLQPFTAKEHWFLEGVTNYYADITSAQLGYLSEREFLDRLEHACELYLAVSNEFAIADMRDSRLSYNGGSLVAAALDLEIREQKKNRRNLAHVMQQMYQQFGDTTMEYTQRDIIRAVNKVAGKDFEPFFQTYIVGKERLPLAEYFDKAGLNVQVNSEELPTADYVEEVLKASLQRDTGVEVTSINGARIGSLKELRKIAKHWKSGEAVTLSFEENGKPVTVTDTLKGVSDNPPTESEVVVRITKQAETTKLQRAILASILGRR